MSNTIGLFVHYRPVVLALPTGGCQAVARYLGFEDSDLLQQALDGAGLLYRHPEPPCFRKVVTPLISTPGGLRT